MSVVFEYTKHQMLWEALSNPRYAKYDKCEVFHLIFGEDETAVNCCWACDYVVNALGIHYTDFSSQHCWACPLEGMHKCEAGSLYSKWLHDKDEYGQQIKNLPVKDGVVWR